MSDFIWRFEKTNDGCGIYSCRNRPPAMVNFYSIKDHPNPDEDWDDCRISLQNRLKKNYGMIFGFGSIEQTRNWFNCPNSVRSFDLYDISLTAWKKSEVRQAYYGTQQCVFERPGIQPSRLMPSHLYVCSEEELEKTALEKYERECDPIGRWSFELGLMDPVGSASTYFLKSATV